MEAARSLEVPAAAKPAFELAIVEALTNAFRHGRGRGGPGSIVCELEHEARSLVVRIFDSGPGFTLARARLPDPSGRDGSAVPEAGYGLPMIQAVFPGLRTVTRHDRFGLELPLRF